jgi:hypothetical protein
VRVNVCVCLVRRFRDHFRRAAGRPATSLCGVAANCGVCGRPIESGGPGRAASSCSQACRQRAYRERRQPAPGAPAGELVADIGDRLRRLRLDPAPAFHADVEALSPRFAQLRRLARQARQARQATPVHEAPGQDVPDHDTARPAALPGEPGTVTPETVTPEPSPRRTSHLPP